MWAALNFSNITMQSIVIYYDDIWSTSTKIHYEHRRSTAHWCVCSKKSTVCHSASGRSTSTKSTSTRSQRYWQRFTISFELNEAQMYKINSKKWAEVKHIPIDSTTINQCNSTEKKYKTSYTNLYLYIRMLRILLFYHFYLIELKKIFIFYLFFYLILCLFY